MKSLINGVSPYKSPVSQIKMNFLDIFCPMSDVKYSPTLNHAVSQQQPLDIVDVIHIIESGK